MTRTRTAFPFLGAAAAFILSFLLAGTSGVLAAQSIDIAKLQARLQAEQQRQAALAAINADKATYVTEIMNAWVQWADSAGFDQTWQEEFTRVLMGQPTERLLAIRNAPSYADVVRIISGKAARGSVGRTATVTTDGLVTEPPPPQLLGQDNSDLVYFPINPCRIFDTREPGAGGPLLANTERSFAHNQVFASQGGHYLPRGNPDGSGGDRSYADCGFPNTSGGLRAWSHLDPTPFASVLTYPGGAVISNTPSFLRARSADLISAFALTLPRSTCSPTSPATSGLRELQP